MLPGSGKSDRLHPWERLLACGADPEPIRTCVTVRLPSGAASDNGKEYLDDGIYTSSADVLRVVGHLLSYRARNTSHCEMNRDARTKSRSRSQASRQAGHATDERLPLIFNHTFRAAADTLSKSVRGRARCVPSSNSCGLFRGLGPKCETHLPL